MLTLSAGITAFADAATHFTYNGKSVQCELKADWKVGNDVGTARTYVVGGSGTSPLGAFCNAYKNGNLLGGDSITSFDEAKISVSYTADQFRSTHNIQNSNRVPLKSTYLVLSE